MAFALLLATAASLHAAPTLAIINKAKAIVEEARYQLPTQINGMTLTQVSFDSKTNSLVYRWYMPIEMEKPSAEMIKERKQAIVHLIKGNPDIEDSQLIKGGISFWYNYYNPDGTFLYAVKVTPADIR